MSFLLFLDTGEGASNPDLFVGNYGFPLFYSDFRSEVFTDVAGTTAATDTDQVALVKDINGTSLTFFEVNSVDNPTLTTESGFKCLYFNESHILQSTNIINTYFRTYGVETYSDKPFTWAFVVKPEVTTSRQDWIRMYSDGGSASTYTRTTLTANQLYIAQNHDVPANLTNLNYESTTAASTTDLNLIISTFDGERGTHFLHNNSNDLTMAMTRPWGHNSPMDDLNTMLIGGASGSAFAKGYLYALMILPGVYFGLPKLVNFFASQFSGAIPTTSKEVFTYQKKIYASAPLQYVDGDCAGVRFPHGKFDLTATGALSSNTGRQDDVAVGFNGVLGNRLTISRNSTGGVISQLANIDEFGLVFGVKFNSFSAIMSPISCYSGTAANAFWSVRIDHTVQRIGIVIFDGLGANTSAFSTFTMSTATWYNIWLLRYFETSGSTYRWSIQVNNETAASVEAYTNRKNTTTDVVIGDEGATRYPLNGDMTDLVFFSKTPTAQDISDYNSTNLIL